MKRVECLVQDPTNDIILVANFSETSFDAVRDLTDAFLCPSNLQAKVSEMKPVPGNKHAVPFVEIYNAGSVFLCVMAKIIACQNRCK